MDVGTLCAHPSCVRSSCSPAAHKQGRLHSGRAQEESHCSLSHDSAAPSQSPELPAERQNNCSSQGSAADLLSVIRGTRLSLGQRESPGKEVTQSHTHACTEPKTNKQTQREQQPQKNPRQTNPWGWGGNREKKGEKKKNQ